MDKIKLNNNITIILLSDELLDNDLIIKFRNYGSIVDSITGINGFQHLLEHCFFFKTDNYNFLTNASTTFSDMCLELNINSKNVVANNESINILKKWLFKDDDYTRLNFSRNLTDDEIMKYINELDNEFFFRQHMNIPWDLQNFFVTNKKNHYFGGNRETFFGRESEIKKWLNDPYPIKNEDIFIFLRKSCRHFLGTLKNIFSSVQEQKNIKMPLLTYNRENWLNKVVKINNMETCDLIFILSKKIITKNELILLSMLFDNFTFTDISYMSDYYCSFMFSDINKIINFLKIGNEPNIFYTNTFFGRDYLSKNLLYADKFDIVSTEYFRNMNTFTTKNVFFELHKKAFINISDIFAKAIINKEYVINNKMDNFIKYNTFANEPYDIDDIKFNYNIFFNQIVEDYFDNPIFNNNKKNYKCFNNDYIEMDLTQLTNSINSLNIYKSDKKPNINFYFNALILFYSTSNNSCFEDIIKALSTGNNLNNKIDVTNNIVFKNKIYEIKTDYDFFFSAFIIPKNKDREIREMKINLNHKLKREGLLYHLDSYCVKYNNKIILYYFSSCRQEDMDKIFNNLQSSLLTNGIPSVYNFIKSYKSNVNNFSKLKKKILTSS